MRTTLHTHGDDDSDDDDDDDNDSDDDNNKWEITLHWPWIVNTEYPQ